MTQSRAACETWRTASTAVTTDRRRSTYWTLRPFDLVVLDLNLPRIDGMTVLGELRKTDCETKVLILSARGEVSDKVAGLDAGANDYLTKPFHLDELGGKDSQPYPQTLYTKRHSFILRKAPL